MECRLLEASRLNNISLDETIIATTYLAGRLHQGSERLPFSLGVRFYLKKVSPGKLRNIKIILLN